MEALPSFSCMQVQERWPVALFANAQPWVKTQNPMHGASSEPFRGIFDFVRRRFPRQMGNVKMQKCKPIK